MYAYAHTPLDEETIKLISFSSGDKLFSFMQGFYGFKGLPNYFPKQMSTFLKTLIEQGFALVYIDDILLLSKAREHMFQLKEQLHTMSTKNSLKLAPENPFSCFSKLNSWDIKVATMQSNLFTRKLQLSTKSLLLMERLL